MESNYHESGLPLVRGLPSQVIASRDASVLTVFRCSPTSQNSHLKTTAVTLNWSRIRARSPWGMSRQLEGEDVGIPYNRATYRASKTCVSELQDTAGHPPRRVLSAGCS